MRRRILLLGATAPALLTATMRSADAAPGRRTGRRQIGPAPRRLQLRHAATGARFSGPYHDGTLADPAAMAELSIVLADTRTGAVHPFDPRAIDILWEVARQARIGGGDLVVLSGYRTPETNAAVDGAGDSQHLRAGALDVQVASAQLTGFAEAALALGRGGVGVYQRRGFVHVDSGPVRRWGDVAPGPAGPGRAPADDRIARMAEAWAALRGR
ncbi:hypothetical protein GCM10011504_22190 [Siccirubricoccus deserti]|uniref:Murein endopeptidase K n=1 Tax=Siccirubricoccus deserti TaxID=2013562 RepID=A0A9X0QYY7_9PROT|nr:DUF882 domain-containing protein [Siccirubricoccus deserti]MBC4015637.1 DUF882 domain-containing protein [Siccirubricoccus deserti]GGC43334.1 hypothetical protein GCM10011504_22190 [Siccirubricoccus deserti]